MKLIIAGSRSFNNYQLLEEKIDEFLGDRLPVEILSGYANGADKLGEQWANKNKIRIRRYLPDWNKYGKAAGPIRNEEMARNATHCIVFWDGTSKGTQSMIDLAKKYNLILSVIKF